MKNKLTPPSNFYATAVTVKIALCVFLFYSSLLVPTLYARDNMVQ